MIRSANLEAEAKRLPRFSLRSLVAVVTFIATGALTVLAVRLLGGAS